jgi:hypothetical protein
MATSFMKPNAHEISGLMQKLKSGEISKAELFQQLSKLQSGPSTASTVARDSNTSPNTDDSTRVSMCQHSSLESNASKDELNPALTRFQSVHPYQESDRQRTMGVSQDQAKHINVQQVISRMVVDKKTPIAANASSTNLVDESCAVQSLSRLCDRPANTFT